MNPSTDELSEYFEHNVSFPSNLKKLIIDMKHPDTPSPTDVFAQLCRIEEDSARSIAEATSSSALQIARESVNNNKELFTLSRTKQMATGLMPRSRDNHLKERQRGERTVARIQTLLNERNITFQDTFGFRTRAAYRLVRYMSYIRGDFDDKGRVSEAIAMKHSVPQPYTDQGAILIAGTDAVRVLLTQWTQSPDATVTSITPDRRNIVTSHGPCYLPPPIPDLFYIRDLEDNDIPATPENIAAFRATNVIPSTYDPEEDTALTYFLHTYALLADFLDLYDGTEVEPDAGALGMAGLLNPLSARTAWPTINDLSLFEYELCTYVYDMETAAEAGEHGTVSVLSREFGYTPFESKEVRKMAIAQGEIESALDENQSRALLIAKTAKMASSAQQNMEYRDALAALKQEAQLRKLNQHDQNDSWADLKQMVTSASGQSLLE